MTCQTCICARSRPVIKPSMELNRHIIIDVPVTEGDWKAQNAIENSRDGFEAKRAGKLIPKG